MFEDIPFLSYLLSAFIGIGLAAATGFRVFLPIFLVSLFSYLGWIPVSEGFAWLSNVWTLIATAVAMLVEVLSYYIPYVDNLLDSISIPLSTLAGSVIFASQFADIGAFPQWALALIAGGGTAATISSAFAGVRATSTATTGGVANPVVATTETAASGVMTLFSVFLPVLAGIISVVLIGLSIYLIKKLVRKFKKQE